MTEFKIQSNRTHAIASITSLLGGFPSSSLACEQAVQFNLKELYLVAHRLHIPMRLEE